MNTFIKWYLCRPCFVILSSPFLRNIHKYLNPDPGLDCISHTTSTVVVSSRKVMKPQYLCIKSYPIALKLDRRLDNFATEVPVKFQYDLTTLSHNLNASRLYDTLK